jgi:hypothetical protein
MKSSGRLDHLPVGHHLGARVGAEAAGAQQRARRQADEAVAAEALAAHHGFEQEAQLAAALRMGQLEVERERGFQIGEGLDDHGNAVVAVLGQALEFEFSDHSVLSKMAPGVWFALAAARRLPSFQPAPLRMRATGRERTATAVLSGAACRWLTPGPGSPACA